MRLFLVGLLALLCQVVLLRELNVAFYGVELVYAVALAAWMAGGAAGAAVFSRRLPATSVRLSWLLAAAAALSRVDVAVIRGSRLALGGVPGAFLPFEQQVLVLAASVLPSGAGARARLQVGRRARGGAGTIARLGLRRRERRRRASAPRQPRSRSPPASTTFTVAVLTAGLVPSVLLASALGRLPFARGLHRRDRLQPRVRWLSFILVTARSSPPPPRSSPRASISA